MSAGIRTPLSSTKQGTQTREHTALCNFSAYLHYESGIFNENCISTWKQSLKSLFTSKIFSLLEKGFICMGQGPTFSHVFFFTWFRITHPFLSKCMLRMRKPRKSNLIQIFFWRTKVSEPVSKRDWHNMRSYLFFNMQKFRTQCAETSRFCMQVRRFSRQDCFYKSLLLHWKWPTPVSGQVLWVRNGHKWGLWCVITTCKLIITDFPGGLECTRSSKRRFGSPII